MYPQAKIAFRRMVTALRAYPVKVNRATLTLTFPHGVRIEFKSGHNPDHLYGENVIAAVIDEASRVQEASIVAIRSTLTATGGPWRLIGNVRGVGNYFYRLCRSAQAGTLPGATYHRINAYLAASYADEYPGLPKEAEVEEAKALLPAPVFRELYLADPSGEDTNPFGLEAIRACVGVLSDNPVAAFGVDVARSVDFTVIIGLDAEGAVAYWDRFQLPWDGTVERIAAAVQDRPCFLDATGVGSPVVDFLRRDYDCWVDPYVFTQPSKMALMERLGLAIHGRQTRYPEQVAEELETLEYHYTRNGVSYEAASGYHDDCVMALGLALAKLRQGKWSWDVE